MSHSRQFFYIAAASLILPGIVIAVSLYQSSEMFLDVLEELLVNWITIILPQLFVISLAIVFSQMRKKYATRALILLTGLFLLFSWITSLAANGAMLWVFYFGVSILLLMALAVLPSPRKRTRGVGP